jgi:ABC-type uncharacterized transport system permease subunit
MSTPPHSTKDLQDMINQLPKADAATADSLNIKSGEGHSEKLVDAIEMIGEEQAAGLHAPSLVSPGMRYLHCSRTIHQLVTDRNRAVGIYLAVASLLLTASSALFHAHPQGDLIIPVDKVQRWCLPITFATLTVLAVFVAFLLIRTRAGLIYEVAKMNALLGLPLGRVQRLSPLSIFFIMQVIISLAGGLSAGLFSVFMIYLADPYPEHALAWGFAIGTAVTISLILLYMVTVTYITSDKRLQNLEEKK